MGFDSLSLARFGSRHTYQGTTLVVPKKLLKETFLAPQARAQLLPASVFGLLGRNAAERAKKEKRPFLALPRAVRSRTVANESEQPKVKPNVSSV